MLTNHVVNTKTSNQEFAAKINWCEKAKNGMKEREFHKVRERIGRKETARIL